MRGPRGRVGLREVDDGVVDHEAAAERRPRDGRLGQAARQGPRVAPRAGDAEGARQRRLDDLPGSADVAEPDVDRGAADRRGRPAAPRRDEQAGADPGPRGARARRHAASRRAARLLPAPALRRPAPARDDRHGAGLLAEAAHRGRADDRAGRDDPGADPRPARRAAQGPEDGRHPDHARPRRDRGQGQPGHGDVRRQDRRGRGHGRAVRGDAASVHRGALPLDPAPRSRPLAGAVLDSGRATGSVRGPPGLPVRPALPLRDRPLPRRGAAARSGVLERPAGRGRGAHGHAGHPRCESRRRARLRVLPSGAHIVG